MNLQETLAKVREALQKPMPSEFAKSFVQSPIAIQGVTYYDLDPVLWNIYPVTAILRNMIPRRVGGRGIQANWRSLTQINPGLVDIGVQEGTRGGIMNQTVTNNLAAFAFFGLENSLTWEADYAAEGLDDLKATATKILLESTMEAEEKVIIGGNAITPLANTGTITTVPHTTGGTITNQSGFVGCVALTYDGYTQSSVAAGVKLPYTRTNADGTTTPVTGFYSRPATEAAATTTGVGAVNSITASVPAVPNAWGYAWYYGLTAAETLVAITSAPTVLLTDPPAGGAQAYAALGVTNVSTNGLHFDGLVTQASHNGGYVIDLGGATMTSTGSGSGGIAEIDLAIETFFSSYRMIPTHIFISGMDQKGIRNLILNGNTNVAPFTVVDGKVIGGAGAWMAYRNPIGFGNPTLEIVVHPFIPQGTILFYTDKLPYAMQNLTDICKMNLRRDYMAITWPLVTRKWFYGVYFDGVLQHYAPFSMGVISGIGVS